MDESSYGNKKEATLRNRGKYNEEDGSDSANKQAEEGGLPKNDVSNNSSTLDIPDKGYDAVSFLPDVGEIKHALLAIDNKDICLSEIVASLPKTVSTRTSKEKLLVLDLNGLLVDIVSCPPKGLIADIKIRRRSIFTRPFCLDFLKFCFERFEVGIWSSRIKKNIDDVIDLVMGDMKHKLLFCWDLSHCTLTQFNTLENKHKPLVFKELRKIWEKEDPELPWEKGYYNESNTLLLDDSPYKALLNPAHTAIFPYSYWCQDRQDNSLGDGGNLRIYLERLAEADNTQKFVEQHPFGQKPINERSARWGFYLNVISSLYPNHRIGSTSA